MRDMQRRIEDAFFVAFGVDYATSDDEGGFFGAAFQQGRWWMVGTDALGVEHRYLVADANGDPTFAGDGFSFTEV